MRGIISIGALLGIVFFIVYAYIESTTKVIISKPIYTIGTVVRFQKNGISTSRGDDAVIEYYVLGNKYSAFISYDGGMVIGDKYEVEYEKEHPHTHNVLETQMLFLRSEYTKKEVATISYLGSIKSLGYWFIVNGTEYIRFQVFDENKYSPKIGDEFEVEYLVDNPQRAIIHLSKPLN